MTLKTALTQHRNLEMVDPPSADTRSVRTRRVNDRTEHSVTRGRTRSPPAHSLSTATEIKPTIIKLLVNSFPPFGFMLWICTKIGAHGALSRGNVDSMIFVTLIMLILENFHSEKLKNARHMKRGYKTYVVFVKILLVKPPQGRRKIRYIKVNDHSQPENILCLTKTGNRIKIIDFGLARFYDPDKKLQVLFGTPEFVAPEVVNFDQIGYGTDMWSVGVICYVLLSGLSPFMGETDIETMANVTVAKYDFDDEAFNEISEEAKDFISKLLVKDIGSRPSAAECLRHEWLGRRPPPPHRPAPPRHPTELDVAKDNLRLFVERWSEHPNSPYVFDNEAHEITCLLNDRSSIGGCSPSPRSSLASSPDLIVEDEDFEPPPLRDSFLPTKYNPVERRASDSTCFLHKKADVLVRKNLAEEIKKLSDHLFMLSTMNTDLANNNSAKEMDKNVSESATNVNKTESKLSNGFKKETNVVTRTAFMNGDAHGREKKIMTSKSFHRISSNFFGQREQEAPMTSNMPWAKSARSKRVTNMSRDVPDQPIDKRNTFFEEFDKRREKIDKLVNGNENGRQLPYRRGDENNAHRTKDLLLHLLEKWGENDDVGERTAGGTSGVNGRHQSISLELTQADRLAQNSMSSLHLFFQRQNSDEKTQRKKQKNPIQSSK
ncbi:Myosin light chain kinase, smooth muscle [Eumeta japonica]|uniref:Myosin light chain kinase, smooth muscle n=1 Tax=Eumeta variegata TaxID=151549 RepID=A0A4C1XN69_EUMVA|nr:Myosin light chain kinase, smooth muscle [Eumeta japonica]